MYPRDVVQCLIRFPKDRKCKAQVKGVALSSVMNLLRISSNGSRGSCTRPSSASITDFCNTSSCAILMNAESLGVYLGASWRVLLFSSMPITARKPTNGLSKILPWRGCSSRARQKSKHMWSSGSDAGEAFAAFSAASASMRSKRAIWRVLRLCSNPISCLGSLLRQINARARF